MMVDRYTNWTEQTDFPDGFADGGALRGTRRTVRTVTTTFFFAKVRVASSNLVIRSKKYQVSGPARAADLRFRLSGFAHRAHHLPINSRP